MSRTHPGPLCLAAAFVVSVASNSPAGHAQDVPGTAPSTLSPTSAATVNLSASGSNNSPAKFASGAGNVLFLGAGTLLPLLEDGPQGREHALRTADSLLVSTALATGLKLIVRERRPDGSARNSFPSGHATAAFAVATMQANYHPKQALLWYGGATLIALSRVKLNRHYTHDVIAGAALGYGTARLELSRPRGLILSPFIRSDRRNASGGSVRGIAFSGSF